MTGQSVSRLDYLAYQEFLREAFASDSNDELHELLRQAISDDLTERQKQVVLMYYFDGYTMPRISQKLGLNVSTVHRHIKAAKKKLKRCMKYGAKKLLILAENA